MLSTVDSRYPYRTKSASLKEILSMESEDVRNLHNFGAVPHSQDKHKVATKVTGNGHNLPIATGIPIDWAHLSTMGSIIPGSRFICFKTPFDDPIHADTKDVIIFTTKHLLQEVKNRQIRLGMVVDLTDSERYYKPTALIEAGLGHLKIRVPGSCIPAEGSYELFRHQVDRFLADPEHSDQLVGVHCTHGINRTGWFVCRYMMEKTGLPARTAVQLFNMARGHEMQRAYLVQDLFNRCHTRSPPCSPGRPAKMPFTPPGNLRGDFADVNDDV